MIIKKNKGFTIIELLVAMTLISVVVFFISPLMAMSYSQVHEAGDMNSTLYQEISAIETDIGKGKLGDGVANSANIGVVFEGSGAGGENTGGVAGGQVFTGNNVSELETFVGQLGSVSVGLTIDPTFLIEGEIPDSVNELKIEANGFDFTDVGIFKLTDKNGTSVLTGAPAFNITDVKNATMKYAKTTMTAANSPYKVHYGSFSEYISVVVTPMDQFDLFAGGAGGNIFSANNLQNANSNDSYIWIPQGSVSTLDGSQTGTINEILWLTDDDVGSGNDGKYVGMGTNGMFFEITDDLGFDFIDKSGKVEDDHNKVQFDYVLKDTDNKNTYTTGIVSPFAKNTVEFVGTISNRAGIYSLTLDTSLNSTIKSAASSSNLTSTATKIGIHGSTTATDTYPQGIEKPYTAPQVHYLFAGHSESYQQFETPMILNADVPVPTATTAANSDIIGNDSTLSELQLYFGNQGETVKINDVAMGILGDGNYKSELQSSDTDDITTILATGSNRLYYKVGNDADEKYKAIEYSKWYVEDDYYKKVYRQLVNVDTGKPSWNATFDWRNPIEKVTLNHWLWGEYTEYRAVETKYTTRYAIGRYEPINTTPGSSATSYEPLTVAYGKTNGDTGTILAGYADGRIFSITDPDSVAVFDKNADGTYKTAEKTLLDSNAYNQNTTEDTLKIQDLGSYAINSIAYGADYWVAVGDNGNIWYKLHNEDEWTKVEPKDFYGYRFVEEKDPTTGNTISMNRVEFKPSKNSNSVSAKYVKDVLKDTESSDKNKLVDFNKVVFVGDEDKGEFFIVGDNATFLHARSFKNNTNKRRINWVLDEVYQSYDVDEGVLTAQLIVNQDKVNLDVNAISKLTE